MDCQPGKSPEHIEDGGTVPVEQTSSTIPVDLVNDIMRRPYRERFRLLITELGTGLAGPAGRPPGGAQARASGPPRDLPGAADPRQPERGHQELHHRLGHGRERAREEQEGRGRAGSRRPATPPRSRPPAATRSRAQFQRFPTFLDELRPTMARLGELADEQTPLLADLERAAPDLNTFFTRLGPFAEASRPAVPLARRDGRGGHEGVQRGQAGGRRAEQARRERAGLRRSRCASSSRRSTTASARSRPTRAPRRPRRRRPTRPPSPARAASPASRRSGTTSSGRRSASTCWTTPPTSCARRSPPIRSASSGSTTSPNQETIDKCNSYLGPYQPGITSADPLDDGTNPSAASVRAERRQAADSRAGERRGEGMPEAGPLPGQPDLSKPQIVLPPDVQRTLDSMSRSQRQRLKEHPRRAPAQARRRSARPPTTRPPASSSTTCSRHETTPRTGTASPPARS